jgi:hypothetical protein
MSFSIIVDFSVMPSKSKVDDEKTPGQSHYLKQKTFIFGASLNTNYLWGNLDISAVPFKITPYYKHSSLLVFSWL